MASESVTPNGMWSQGYLQCALALVGLERWLFSTDYPCQHKPGRRFLKEIALSGNQRALFAHGN